MSQPDLIAADSERRASTRIPVNERATLLLGHLGSATQCTLLDLSLDGCRLRTDASARLDAGERVELVFRAAGTQFRLGGEAEWASANRDFGVLFTTVSPRREAELVEALGELAVVWQAKQAERQRAEEALKTLQELVAQRAAELEAGAMREAALRAEAEQAAREKREAEERLKAARKELAEAEKAAQEWMQLAASELAGVGAAKAAKAAAAPSKKEAALPQAAAMLPRAGTPPTAGTPHAAPSGRERRQAERHAVDSTATVLLLDARSNVRGRIIDVSISGCRIRFDEKFPVGIYRRVEVEFLLDGLPFRLPGVVQSLHDRFTAGIRFVDLSDRKREQLLFVIEEIDEMPREPQTEAR